MIDQKKAGKQEKNSVADYLDAVVTLLRHQPGLRARNGFLSIEHFVLTYGLNFVPQPRPRSRYAMGAIRECFRNAALLAIGDPELIYVEGYALGVIPTLHAWCLTAKGHRVVEPTWRERGTEYLGIPFRGEYLHACLRRYRCYGLIDQPEAKFPILGQPPGKWLHPDFCENPLSKIRVA